jgi:hypothetical protein
LCGIVDFKVLFEGGRAKGEHGIDVLPRIGASALCKNFASTADHELRLNEFNIDFASGGMGIDDAQRVRLVHVDPAGLHCQ